MKKQGRRIEKAVRLREKGLSYAEVGRVLGVTRQRVYAMSKYHYAQLSKNIVDTKRAKE